MNDQSKAPPKPEPQELVGPLTEDLRKVRFCAGQAWNALLDRLVEILSILRSP